MAKLFTFSDVAKHNLPGDLWLAIGGDVYDVSKFINVHPGGAMVLEQLAGGDATAEFFELHRKDVLAKYSKLKIGRLEGALDELPRSGGASTVPFADAPAFQGTNSPYYKDHHLKLQQATRKFVQEEMAEEAVECDISGEIADMDFRKKVAMAGLCVTRLGPGPWIKDAASLGISIPGEVPPEEFDYFHELLVHQEVASLGTPGFMDGCGGGHLISIPAILNFGSTTMKQTVGRDLLVGDVTSALAISEPYAGSDVANIRATAVKTADGKHYVVNGVKKWITEGMVSEYFVTAVRTGGPGAKGISLLVIKRGPGVETKAIKTTYSSAAGTALVLLRDVKVPVANLLGSEDEGFKLIMYNFNHERWYICCNTVGLARGAVADAFMWARQRSIFGQSLLEQPVIRNKLALAASDLESVHALLESVTFDMCSKKEGAMGPALAGPIAMLKLQATRAAWRIADNVVQILGGRGITKTGMGRRVENFKNFAKYGAVYGGSEEIMADLTIKQALKRFPEGLSAKL